MIDENKLKEELAYLVYRDIQLKDPVNKLIEIIDNQPKVSEWIPCSQRLPNEEECNIYDENNPLHRQFLCTIKIGNNEPQTRQLFFSKVFGWKYGPTDYNEFVLAWQPLPKPMQLCRKPLSDEDSVMKCAYAHAYEKDKNALLNIIAGKHWNADM